MEKVKARFLQKIKGCRQRPGIFSFIRDRRASSALGLFFGLGYMVHLEGIGIGP